jgi:hypothetical protein
MRGVQEKPAATWMAQPMGAKPGAPSAQVAAHCGEAPIVIEPMPITDAQSCHGLGRGNRAKQLSDTDLADKRDLVVGAGIVHEYQGQLRDGLQLVGSDQTARVRVSRVV